MTQPNKYGMSQKPFYKSTATKSPAVNVTEKLVADSRMVYTPKQAQSIDEAVFEALKILWQGPGANMEMVAGMDISIRPDSLYRNSTINDAYSKKN